MNTTRFLLAAASTLALTLAPRPGPVQADSPTGRARHLLVEDPASHQLLSFTGAASAPDANTLWSFDGSRWHALSTALPAPSNAAGAFDTHRRRLVVHGGSGTGDRELDETWEWDGREWRRVSTAGPGARAHHAMAYDPIRQQMVLFGNSDAATDNETWGWNGQQWTLLATDGPPRRGVHTMAFDTKRGVVVLFGGIGSKYAVLNDTWEWDGAKWRQVVTDEAPSPRWDTRMAYDPGRGRIVLFGGRSRSTNYDDTWEFDGRRWVRLQIAGPSARNGHAMAYDSSRKAIVLFGGRHQDARPYLNDLWSFDGAWSVIPDGRPSIRGARAGGS